MANLVEFIGVCTLWFILCCGIGVVVWLAQEVKKADIKVAKVLNSRTIRYVRASTLERIIYVLDSFTMSDKVALSIVPFAIVVSSIVLSKYYLSI